MAVDVDTSGKLSPSAACADEVTLPAETRRTASPLVLALIAGVASVLALVSLSAWLGVQDRHTNQAKSEREQYLQVARQGALDLTTIDYEHAEEDVGRILGSATGQFHDDFSQRTQPFVDFVKKARSSSQGTVIEAGLESYSGSEAQVIVAVSVMNTVAGQPEQQPRSWRMRLTVQRAGDDLKISNVGFVA